MRLDDAQRVDLVCEIGDDLALNEAVRVRVSAADSVDTDVLNPVARMYEYVKKECGCPNCFYPDQVAGRQKSRPGERIGFKPISLPQSFVGVVGSFMCSALKTDDGGRRCRKAFYWRD